jgi:ribose 1,5-bisphosphokinase
VVFAHRYITRPFDAGGENFISLLPSEFALRQSAHLFWLAWQSHGLHYGIGREVLLWLSSGVDVVVNGSRAYLSQVQALATQENVLFIPVWIHCDRDILADRLMRRGRESASDIAERLAAADRYVMPDHAVVIDNSQALASSTAVFLALFQDAHDAD